MSSAPFLQPASLPSTRPPGRGRWRRSRGVLVGVLVFVLAGAAWWWHPWANRPTTTDGGAVPWRLAQLDLARHDVSAARQQLERCVKAWPLNADAHFLLARTCRRLDDIEGWRTHLHRAVLLHWPQRDIQLEEQLQQAQSGQLLSVEQSLLDRVNRLPPEEPVILEALVRGYLANDRLPEAMNLTNAWANRHPQDWLPWYYRGLAYRAKRFNTRAEGDFQHVLELNPNQPDSQIVLAILYASDGRYRAAEPLFESYLKQRPDDGDALYGLASCQQALAHTTEATATLRQLLSRHKDHAAGLLLQGKLQLTDGQLHEALASLRRAYALKPNNIEVVQNLSVVLAQLHRPDEAAPYEKRVKELQEASQRLQSLERQIQQDPGNLSLRYEAAVLCLKNGWEEESAHWFQTILYIDPQHRPTHRALADYFARHADPARAAYHRRAAGDTGDEQKRR